jgi:hypothetical protein
MTSISRCTERTNVSKVKVQELGRKAIFKNKNRAIFCKTRVDGCVVKNAIAADWVLSKGNVGQIVIELKGRDVDHAVKQIEATTLLWREKNLVFGKLAGLVVCAQYPRANTMVQRAQDVFSRKFKGPLHIVTRNCEYVFEKVLAFDEPL